MYYMGTNKLLQSKASFINLSTKEDFDLKLLIKMGETTNI